MKENIISAINCVDSAIEALNSATDSKDFDYAVSQLERIKDLLGRASE